MHEFNVNNSSLLTDLGAAGWGIPIPTPVLALPCGGTIQFVSIVTAVVGCVALYPDFAVLGSIQSRARFYKKL